MGQSTETQGRPLLIKGERVGLALMTRDDIPTLARWNQDLEFTALMGTPGEAHSLEMRQDFFDQNARLKSDGVEFAALTLKDGELVGFGGLFDITRALTATLFVGIAPDKQEAGLGKEVTRLVCEYGFFFRSLHGIKVEVNGYNVRALALYEALGFRPVGRLRETILLDGRRYDQVLMDLLRHEFELRHVASFTRLAALGDG